VATATLASGLELAAPANLVTPSYQSDPVWQALSAFQAAAKASREAPESDEESAPFFTDREQKLQDLGEVIPTNREAALQLLKTVYEEEADFVDANSPLHGVIENVIAFLEGR
jgi:hypothetical protein